MPKIFIAAMAVVVCLAGCTQTSPTTAGTGAVTNAGSGAVSGAGPSVGTVSGESTSRRVAVPDNASIPAPPSAAPTLTGLNSNVEDPNGTGVGAQTPR